ncbi:MAG: YqhA family protein, partial [Pseudomonadota bacterium]
PMMSDLFQFRFKESGELEGHNFGNLFILAMLKITGDFEKAIKESSKILVISNLDDLKSRLAKVILMIMIVTLFEEALNIHIAQPIDLVYFGAAIALIALALYWTHAADGHGNGKSEQADSVQDKSGH